MAPPRPTVGARTSRASTCYGSGNLLICRRLGKSFCGFLFPALRRPTKPETEGQVVTGPLTDTVAGLVPGNSVELQRVWDTTGVALGDYRVIGYVLYDARSTGASTVALTNLRRVYLPVVLRDF